MHKTISLVLALILATQSALGASQQTFMGKATVGTPTAVNTASIFDTVSTTKGTRPCPSMTQTQRDAVSSPVTGLCVFNTTTNKFNNYNGSSWQEMGGGAGGIYAGGQNLISNNSWETDTSGYTSTATGTGCSGSTGFARTTTNGQFIPPGVAGGCLDSASAAETLVYTATTINANDGLAGRNGVVSCAFRAASGTATHTITAYDGSNNIVTPQTITSSTTNWQRTSVNFPFPASGTVQLKIASVASNEPVLYIDDCYMGLAENFNISQASQAQFVGGISSALTANCLWQTTSTSFAAFAADSDCPTPTVTGNASAPATKIPGITFSSLPPGVYTVVVTGAFIPDAALAAHLFTISDGTSLSGQGTATAGGSAGQIVGKFTYTAAQGSTTFQVQGLTSSGATASDIDNRTSSANTGVPFGIEVYRFPTTQETYYRPDIYNWRVDASISGANPSLGTSAQASYTGIEDGGLTLTNNTSTTGNVLTAAIPCSSTNASSGTTCGAGNESVGVSFTLPVAGDVRACVSFGTLFSTNGSGAANAFDTYEIVETPNAAQTISQEGKDRPQLANSYAASTNGGLGAALVCGNFSFTSSGQKTLRLFYEQTITNAANISTNAIAADAGASNGQRDIHWVVWPITQNVVAPVLVQGVTAPQNTAGSTVINNFVSKSSTYTATTSDETIIWTATGTQNLPTAISVPGKKYHIGTNATTSTVVTVDGAGSDTTCGQATIIVSGANDGIDIQSDGVSNWVGLNGSCMRQIAGEVVHTANSTCSILAGPGTGVVTASCSSAGVVTVAIASGVYSGTPVCPLNLSENVNDTSCRATSVANSGFVDTCANQAGTGQNRETAFTCRGPR